MFLTMINPFAAGAAPIEPRKAMAMIKKDLAVLVDVREAHEFAGGHAKGAVNVPVGQVAKKADPDSAECLPVFKQGKPLILYCLSGSRSAMAGKVFRKLGHDKVFNFGELKKWAMAGGNVEI